MARATHIPRGVAIIVGAAVALVACPRVLAPRPEADLVVDRGRGPVPASYVGLHIHHAGVGTAWPSVPFASWRLWDAYAAWPWLEPDRGRWTWEVADRLIDLATQHGVEVLLPLGLSPTWASARPAERSAYGRPGLAAPPAQLDDWRRYVAAVATRYAGRVALYEIWNEPNLAEFYTGDVAGMVALCREARAIVRRIDPAARVVSPSATELAGVAWLDRFLAAGGADCFDAVGFHLYVRPDGPEAMVGLVARIWDVLRAHGIADRPLWNTETGWDIARTAATPGAADDADAAPRPGALAEDAAAAIVARALILARAAGIARFYWYAWDNADMGLADRDGRARSPARALAEVERWLVGAVLDGCRRAPGGAWRCALSRDGHRQWIAWNPDGRAPLALPAGWRIARRRELSGAEAAVAPATAAIDIGPAPQLLLAADDAP